MWGRSTKLPEVNEISHGVNTTYIHDLKYDKNGFQLFSDNIKRKTNQIVYEIWEINNGTNKTVINGLKCKNENAKGQNISLQSEHYKEEK